MRVAVAIYLVAFSAFADTSPIPSNATATPNTPSAENEIQDEHKSESGDLSHKLEIQSLDASKRQATAAEGQVIEGAVQLGMSFLGLIGLGYTWKETQRAAKAARDSADAFKEAERPNLSIEYVAIHGLDRNRESNSQEDEEVVHCSWQIKNLGKSPAWVKEISSSLVIATALQKDPLWISERQDWLDVIPPKGERSRSTFLPSCESEFPDWPGYFDYEVQTQLESRTLKIFLSIRVQYRDQFNKPHTISGAWRGVSDQYEMGSFRWTMKACGPESYWKYT